MFTPARLNPPLAVACMMSATLFIAASTMFAKALGTDALGEPLHPLQISHGRFVFAAFALGVTAALLRPTIRGVHWRLHGARTLFGWLGVTLMFAAVAFIPMADATAISFLNPVFAMMLAIPLLGERVGPVRWTAAAVALLGGLVLLRPGPESFQPGALLALAAAVIIGFEIILIKRLTGREAPLQILLVNNVIGLAISSAAVLPVWVPPTPAQWGALAGVGVLMSVAQALYLNAMARAEASFIVPFSYGTLVFAALFDAFIFDLWPDTWSYAGAGLIIAGAAGLAWRETVLARRLKP